MKKSFLHLTFACLLLFAGVTGMSARQLSGGSGTAGDPFLIKSAQDLDSVGAPEYVDGGYYFQIDNDIDVSLITPAFLPIGTSGNPFNGTIDGTNHSIKDVSGTSTIGGVFNEVDGAVVKNLFIVGLPSTTTKGPLANKAKDATFENCYVFGGTIPGGSSGIGGLIGQTDGTVIIRDCYSSADLGTAGLNEIGGLVGYVASGETSISGSNYVAGTLTGQDKVGGLVGHVASAAILSISGSFSSVGTYTTTGRQLGGLVGHAEGLTTISGSYAAGAAISGTLEIGGLVGTLAGTTSIIENSFSSIGTLTASTGQVGGLVGLIDADGIELRTSAVNSATIDGISQVGGFVGEIKGSPTTGTKIIGSYAKIATNLGNANASTEVGGLVGKIGTLTTIEESAADITLFGLSAVTPTYVGGLVGRADATLNVEGSNALSAGAMTGANPGSINLGGLIGGMADGTINNSFAKIAGGITGQTRLGGLIGNASGNLNVFQSYATSNITAYDGYSGGLVGNIAGDADVKESYATGNITALTGATNQTYIGGLIGGMLSASSVVDDCYASGNIVLSVDCNTNHVGGLVAYNSGSVTNSFVTGSLDATGASTANCFNIGGIVGKNQGLVDNCIVRTGTLKVNAAVTVFDNVGGIVGDNNGGTVSNSFAAQDFILPAGGGGTFIHLNRICGQPNGTMINNRANAALGLFNAVPGDFTNENGRDTTDIPSISDLETELAWDNSHWDFTGALPVLTVTDPADFTSVDNNIAALFVPVIDVPFIRTVCANDGFIANALELTGSADSYDWQLLDSSGNPVAGNSGSGIGMNAINGVNFPINSSTETETYQIEVTPTLNGVTYPAVIFDFANVFINPTAKILTQKVNFCDDGSPLDTTIVVQFAGTAPWNYGFIVDGGVASPRTSVSAVDSVPVATGGTYYITPATVDTDAGITEYGLDVTANAVIDGNGCMGTADAVLDSVFANPVYSGTMLITAVVDTIVCNEGVIDAITFDYSATPGAATNGQWDLVWENVNGRASAIGMPDTAGTVTIPQFTAYNTITTNAKPDSAVFNVYALYTNNVSGALCKGTDIMPLTIQVNPIPVLTFTNGVQAICNNASTSTITFNTNIAASSDTTYYLWRNHNTSLGFSQADQGTDSLNNKINPFVALNAGTYPLVDTFSVTPYYTNMVTCMGDSVNAYVTIHPTTTITAQPVDALLCNDEDIHTIGFGSYGTDLTFQWYEKPKYGGAWTAIEGATQSSYETFESGSYYATITSGICNNLVTDTARIEFGKAPYINGLQDSVYVCSGSNYSMAVVSNADSLQWFYEGMPIAGAIDNNYTIVNADPNVDYGIYSVKGYSACRDSGEVTTSQVGYLWVATPLTQPIEIEGLDNIVYTGQTYTAHVGNPSYGFNDVTYYTWSDSGNSADFLLESGANQHTVEVKFTSAVGTDTVKVVMDHVCATGGTYTATKVVKVEKGSAIDGVNVDATVVYPNPFDSELFVSSESDILSVKIYDVNGNLVVNQATVGAAKVVIPVGSLTKGTYLVKVETANGAATYKVVK